MMRDLILVVVWLLVVSSTVQGAIHLMSAWMLRQQDSETRIGAALANRELTLGVKAVFRSAFDALIAIAVTWQIKVTGWPVTQVTLPLVALSAIAAIWFGIRFVRLMGRENWGRAEVNRLDERSAQQDRRGIQQDRRARGQDERAKLLTRRTMGIDTRSDDIGRREGAQNARDEETKR